MSNERQQTPSEIWDVVLAELELSTAKATFNQHLAYTKGLSMENGRFVVGVRNELTLEWLTNRLTAVAQRTFDALHGKGFVVVFQVADLDARQPIEAKAEAATVPLAYRLTGFPDASQNWTKTPDFYFDVVLPKATPTCAKIVGAVIRNTLGRRDKRGNAKEWWLDVTYLKIRRATGLKSDTSISKGLWDGRAMGWIKRRESGSSFDIGLRWHDEYVDYPDEPRPR